MFSKLLNEVLSTQPISSCFEIKTSSGLTITTFGERGLEKVVQTLTRLGLICALASEQPGPTNATNLPQAVKLKPVPFVPFMEGHNLTASINAACRDGIATQLEQVNAKIEELMALAEGEGNLLLSEARQQFLAGFDRARIHHSSLGEYDFIFQTFIDLIGDKKLNTIKSADVTQYLTALAHYPSSAAKKAEFKGKSFYGGESHPHQHAEKAHQLHARVLQLVL